jgi:hypothetical protein
MAVWIRLDRPVKSGGEPDFARRLNAGRGYVRQAALARALGSSLYSLQREHGWNTCQAGGSRELPSVMLHAGLLLADVIDL